MKVIIAYPPLAEEAGFATLGQNRQFQYFKDPTYIYPVVPAQAATLLKQTGHEVMWLDCIAQGISYESFMDIIRKEAPDLIAFETKTPVVKRHWKIIDELNKPSTIDHRPLTVLFGDHVTALPEESFLNSSVDFVLTGGDYDFLLLNLCNSLTPSHTTHYSLRTTELEPGIYFRENGFIKNTGPFRLNHDLNSLPFINRELTGWQRYAYQNGNYKLTPGAYIMSARDCWYHGCTFCSWPTLYPAYRVRSVENVLSEIEILIKRCNVREIMDDSGCFPVGDWLGGFCRAVVERGYDKKVNFDCNMRFGALSQEDFSLMKKANFRLLLFGLESANQKTLDRINKNLKVEKIIEDCKNATAAGLYPHITIMFGYPWEDYQDQQKTLRLGRWLLKKGYAYTMQATVVIPYPGTPLFEECKHKGLLKSLDWDEYDMKEPVMVSSVSDEQIMEMVRSMYKVSFEPEFLMRKLLSAKDSSDLRYFFRAGKKIFGHLFDFSSSRPNRRHSVSCDAKEKSRV